MDFCQTCIPCRKVLIREKDKPWFSSELRYNIRIRDQLLKKYLKTKNENDHILYKRQRNKVINMKKYAQENYFNNLDTLIGNQDSGYANKNFWQVMGRFMGKKSKSETIPPLNKGNNSYAYINSEKANVFNDFFSSVSTIDDNEVPLPHFEKKNTINSF